MSRIRTLISFTGTFLHQPLPIFTTGIHQRWKGSQPKIAEQEQPVQILELVQDIHRELDYCKGTELKTISQYYFDGQGKAIRPVLTMVMASAVNEHLNVGGERLLQRQKAVAKISEMYHTASLVHDDVIDHADTRRKKESVNHRWLQRKSVFAGDYSVAIANKMVASLGNDEVVQSMFDILDNLVLGEFQQMTVKKDKTDRFQVYLDKTYNKTASLMANSCRAVAQLACAERRTIDDKFSADRVAKMAFDFGKTIGMAFQLVDDWLDFAASADQLGKPSNADLNLGLATAPVLFASNQYPELEEMIQRRFSQDGDVEAAYDIVLRSSGMEETKTLAETYCNVAMKAIRPLGESDSKKSLCDIAEKVINRMS